MIKMHILFNCDIFSILKMFITFNDKRIQNKKGLIPKNAMNKIHYFFIVVTHH